VAALYIHAAARGYAQVRAAVADANVLDGHLIGCVRGATWTPLLQAAQGGLLRLYVARQVADEVSEHLEEIALLRRCDPRLAADWWQRARPLLRIVDVPATEDAHYEALRVIDPDDVPTAVLSRIVGTRLTWSYDKVVRRTGFAVPYDGKVVQAITNVVTLDVSGHMWLSLTSAALETAFPAAVRLARRSGQLGMVVGGAAVLVAVGVGIGVARDPAARTDFRNRAAAAGSAIATGMSRLVDYRRQLVAQVPPVPPPDPALPLDLALGRILAFAPAPLYADEITRRATGETLETDIIGCLDASSLFLRGRGGAHQLGQW
jgi:predicted nucleic acid-binding protein